MKWQIEDLGEYYNILEDKPDVSMDDQKPIGMGYPKKVAVNIVAQHNNTIEKLESKIKTLEARNN